jgi:hypothetical protein
VKVIKVGSQEGEEGTIDDPNWTGRVKLTMDSDGSTKSYLAHELEYIDKGPDYDDEVVAAAKKGR